MNKELPTASIEVETVQEKEPRSLMFYDVDILDAGERKKENTISIMLLVCALIVMIFLTLLWVSHRVVQ